MSRSKSADDERQIVVSQPQKRPYGALVRVHVRTAGAFGQVEEAQIPFDTGTFATLAPASSAPWEGGRKYVLRLEGFPTAARAESEARRLVQAVLWMAISSDVPLRLDYGSYDPFLIFDRTRSDGLGAQAYGESYFRPELVFEELKHAFVAFEHPDPNVLLSMEIFAGARLEASDRARFLALVSALEPLAAPKALGQAVDVFVNACLVNLKEAEGLSEELRRSLDGRVRQLQVESIRQSLRRVMIQSLPRNEDAARIVDEAYALRSQIVHTGRPSDLDIDLDRHSACLSRVLRMLYSERFKRHLLRPAA